MTDDIAARLLTNRPNYDDNIAAADEIKRLRAERDALRAELAAEQQSKGTHHLWAQIRKRNAERKAAEAERDELRELLREARGKMQYMLDHGEWYVPEELITSIDAALEGGGNARRSEPR